MEELINSDFSNYEMLASQTFDDILNSVQRSNLNFQIQVSPFSAYISLKKSLVKDKSGSLLPPQRPTPPAADLSPQTFGSPISDFTELVAKINKLENALIVQQKKHEDAMNDRRDELNKLKANKEKLIDDKRKLEIENKTLEQVNKSLETKLEKKVLEAKQLRGNIDELNKDKNALNVALKSIKQDVKCQNKAFEKEITAYEKKVSDLNDFKTKKLNEERQEKLAKKKEIKREAKKNRNVQNNNTVSNENPVVVEESNEENSVEHEEKGTAVVDDPSPHSDPDPSECAHTSLCKADQQRSKSTFFEETTDENCKNIELEEKEVEFIGPRLPRIMTNGEVKAMFKWFEDKYG